ncbi:hypothetical protein CRE_13533 [Caenorhabditis remanei]|uniref:Uncharacterized protein n=1 Tax=Caenorhabditis remanei TaxID=31234 RepID=E3MR56_CAERE|nr:hypothetical protein CRE_13533 [Caenorhabditis remanei]
MRVLQKLGFCLDKQKRETPPTQNTGASTTKRVSVIATDRDRAYFLRQKNMRSNKNSADKKPIESSFFYPFFFFFPTAEKNSLKSTNDT